MEKKTRLTGIDLFRGIATYGVAVLHSGDATTAPVGYWATNMRHLFAFAVPFFLATSFYLIIRKIYVSETRYSLGSRFKRLIIPYVFWTILYFSLKTINFLIFNEHEQLNKLFQDPIAIIFFGAAAVHLYFLPLLISGTLLVGVAEYLLKTKVRFRVLVLMFICSVIVYQIMLSSDNSYQLGPNIAFQGLLALTFPNGNENPFLRVSLVLLSWIVRCLPYILMAMILNHLSIKKGLPNSNVKYGIIFFALNIWGWKFIPNGVNEIFVAYFCLLFALSLSNNLKENGVITSLGLCSFGIYLMHNAVIQFSEIFISRLYPNLMVEVSVFRLLIFSMLGFLVSWLITFILIKKKGIAKLLFGI